MKTSLSLLSALFLLTGCAASYRFTPYLGNQQTWKTSPGAFVETNGAIPIYYGFPPKAYKIVGLMTCNMNSMFLSTRAARARGGEAMILLDSQTINSGSVNVGGVATTFHSGTYFNGSYYGSSQTYAQPSYNVPIENTFGTFAVIKFYTNEPVGLK